MSLAERSYLGEIPVAAEAGIEVRAEFIKKTYFNLAGAIGAFVALEAVLLNLPVTERFCEAIYVSRFGWLAVLGVFMVVSYVANRWAHSAVSLGTQYLGLGLYVVAEAIIFTPLLYIAHKYAGDGSTVIQTAGAMTLITFAGLTAIVFVTRKNFSFLQPVLMLGGLVAFGLIVCSILFGFNLGTIFTVAMIGLASGYILYHTSAVLHEYRIGQHVAAALGLFASVALLFWYILQFVMNRD